MALVKGTSAKLFLAAIPCLIIGAILYGKSEWLSGEENIKRGQTLEVWGAVVFVIGVILLILMMVVGFKGSKK